MFLSSTSLFWVALCVVALWNSVIEAQITGSGLTAIQRGGWTASADSHQAGYGPSYVLDDNYTSFWQTEYSPTLALLPHNITLDMQNEYWVNGFTYLPRQDGSQNGNIAVHTISISVDNKTWKKVASGTWANDQTIKTTLFTPAVARYVRLQATTEANGQQFSSAAELNVLTNPHSTLSRAAWKVTADSHEGGAQSYNATEAIDGADTTYWHTQWEPTAPALPHHFTIDQGNAVTVGGLTYLPRPLSSGPNGRIGSYTVEYSNDGSSWTTIVSGKWVDNANLKTVEFAAVSARYFRLVALTEAGNRGPWTSAAEINLLDGSTQLAPFKITVDSQETAAANNTGIRAMDNDPKTFWETEWSVDPVPGFPHYAIIDMQATFSVKALTYLPRQDGSPNGNIGSHVIDVSPDNTTWTTVATGSFFDDQEPKLVTFEETACRYVRLTALSEAGNRGPWTSAAEISLSFDTSYTPPPATVGQWGLTIDFPLVPVAAALIHNTGNILAWSSFEANQFVGGTGQTVTATYSPSTGEVSEVLVTNTDHDMFCPGLSLDFDGRPFVTGGNDAAKTSIYHPSTNSWVAAPDMDIPRGYQASQTLSDGRIFTIGGSWSGGQGGKNGSVFDYATDTWSLLLGCPVAPMLTNDAAGVYRADNHGWLFAWSNATVFQAGPSVAMNWYTPTGYGGVLAAGPRTGDTDAMCGNAVMYDAVAGNILTVGGSPDYSGAASTWNAHILTLGTPNDTVTVTTINHMNYRRIFGNGVVLPDGSVFIVGGQEYGDPFTDDEAILYPELWNPTTHKFTVMAQMPTPRTYHSVALLMPDATVISGGGGLCGSCNVNHFNMQIFTPPYLFNADNSTATRPVINSVSANSVAVGHKLTVKTNGAISSFALIRIGSTTHTVNTDQRRIPLTPLQTGVNTYSITVPADPGVALPGYWMLFALNSAGVPSLASTIQITLPADPSPTNSTLTRARVRRDPKISTGQGLRGFY